MLLEGICLGAEKWGLNKWVLDWGVGETSSTLWSAKNSLARNLRSRDSWNCGDWQSHNNPASNHTWDANYTLKERKWWALFFWVVSHEQSPLTWFPLGRLSQYLQTTWQIPRIHWGRIRGAVTSLTLGMNILCTLNLTLFLGSSIITCCGL